MTLLMIRVMLLKSFHFYGFLDRMSREQGLPFIGYRVPLTGNYFCCSSRLRSCFLEHIRVSISGDEQVCRNMSPVLSHLNGDKHLGDA